MANDEEPKNVWAPEGAEETPLEEVQAPANENETPFEANQSVDEGEEAEPLQDTPDNPPISWTAHEYIHEERSPLWFVIFVVITLVFVAASIWLQAWTFAVLIIVMAVALMIYIRRPPRELTYALSPAQGLYVGERLYHFDEFKAFGLIDDQGNHSIMMIPRKRFAPGVSVFFPTEAGERIVDILGQRLPMEELKLDVVDTIVRKLRL